MVRNSMAYTPYNGELYDPNTAVIHKYTSGYNTGVFKGSIALKQGFNPVSGEYYWVYVNQIPVNFKFLSYSEQPQQKNFDYLMAIGNAIKTTGICDVTVDPSTPNTIGVVGYNNSFVGSLPQPTQVISVSGDGVVFNVTQTPGTSRPIRTGSLLVYGDSTGDKVINPNPSFVEDGKINAAMIAGVAVAKTTEFSLSEWYQTDPFSRLYSPQQLLPGMKYGYFWYQLPNAELGEPLQVVVSSNTPQIHPGDFCSEAVATQPGVIAAELPVAIAKLEKKPNSAGYAVLRIAV